MPEGTEVNQKDRRETKLLKAERPQVKVVRGRHVQSLLYCKSIGI